MTGRLIDPHVSALRLVSADLVTVADMEPIDLFGIIMNAILGLPAQFVAAYQQNPEQWNVIGLMMAGILVLGWLANRAGRRSRRAR